MANTKNGMIYIVGNMKNKKVFLIPLAALFLILFVAYFISSPQALLFHPKGVIAGQERNLIVLAIIIMSVLAIPVYIMVFFVGLKYREGNKMAKYTPNSIPNKFLVAVWWIVPTIIILILAVINWQSTHKLDPFNVINSSSKPITIQVVSLRWKWLFIYPDQNIATVNFVEFPQKTPINFVLTSDAPMNSFWIPELSGQIYSMTGMSTKIHMMSDTVGDFSGSAAEINGKGFSGMRFVARSVSQEGFENWIMDVKKSPNTLSLLEYEKLAIPSENSPVSYYSSVENGLYNKIIEKFIAPENGENTMEMK